MVADKVILCFMTIKILWVACASSAMVSPHNLNQELVELFLLLLVSRLYHSKDLFFLSAKKKNE